MLWCYNQLRETPPVISPNQLRETRTSAHLISRYLTDGRSVSILRQKARAQKARKLGLSGLLGSFPYINFALLMRRIYVFFRVLNDAFHRGKKSGLMHVVAQGGGGKRRPRCRRKVVKVFHAHTHNMQESQDNAAGSVDLMRDDNQVTGSAAFLLLWRGHHF